MFWAVNTTQSKLLPKRTKRTLLQLWTAVAYHISKRRSLLRKIQPENHRGNEIQKMQMEIQIESAYQ